MKRLALRWTAMLSALAIVIGCQAFGSANTATQGDEPAARRTRLLPPLAEPAGQDTVSNAQEVESSPQPVETTAQDVAATEQEPPTPARQVAKPTESIPSGGCVTSECHSGLKAEKYIHGPVDTGTCDACHEEADSSRHTFEFTEEGAALCESCHEIELEGQYVHQPAAEGLCLECHDPHGGQEHFMLRGGISAVTCTECHDDVIEGLAWVHGPVAAGACTACHRSHSSDNAKLLTLSGRDLCLECHATLEKQLDTVRMVHGPVAVDCTTCHLPHGSEQRMMLNASVPELCLDCHSELEDLLDAATTQHDPVVKGRACRNCHGPHGSDFPALLENHMLEVCLSCHDREVESDDGAQLTNMKAVLETGSALHGPITQRNCAGGCHHVHGGSSFRLLAAEYPAEFYAPFREESYALCFSCHDRQLVFDERTDRLTNFRNGDHNQHYVHVNKTIKGRTCRACHETHASSNPKHVRDAVPFGSGGWKLPINFEKTETGGRCSPGCHRPYAYDRAKAVRNLPQQEQGQDGDQP